MTPEALKTAIDTVWVLFTGCLVFFMCTGFAMLEAGFTRAKHVTNVLAMNFAIVCVTSIVYWAVGFGFMFGTGNGFIGLSGFAPDFFHGVDAFKALEWSTVPVAAKFFFELVFADTAGTIVSGIVAERMKFAAYMLFAVFLGAILYPITGHWVWGGGWLSTLTTPFQDFAGSTVVHSVGGWASLVGAAMAGARLGKFDSVGRPRFIRGHSLALATLGTLILWLGWFGFNPGSTLAADPKAIGHITATTMMAGSMGLMTAMIASWWQHKKVDLGAILNGALAGLVAITAGCNAVSIGGSLWIGGIAGILCYITPFLADKARIDDPVGVLSVHLMNGIWGTLAVGLFATKAASVGTLDGLLYGGGSALLLSQAIGVAAVGAFTVAGSIVFWSVVKATVGLRVSAVAELDGIDLHEHGMEAYDMEHLTPVLVAAKEEHLQNVVQKAKMHTTPVPMR